MTTRYKVGAAAPGLVPPRSDNARLAPGEVEEHRAADSSNSATVDTDGKEFATLVARAARRGLVVHELPGGAFFIARSCWSRELPDAAALEDFLDRWEGRA